ncbi:MAG: DNA polymerase III subunit gamma/tau, partial [Christensenellaceae bacterium]
MAHKALYRKFRPRRFSELKGQTTTAAILRGQIASGEPSHAYLFSGPRGTGKTSAAKITAMALVCQNPQEGEPCLECENCKAALADNMPDIIEMVAACNYSVENARDLRESVALMPVRADRKVYIIDEVHMLTRSAFNALLKTLEEPPEHVVFILATTELQKLPATVLSRCQRFDFRRIGDSEIKERMREVLEAEGGKAEDEALGMIARAAGGALRDALSMLDKCISLGGEITADSVRELIGLSDADALSEMVDCALLGDAKNALKVLAELTDEGAQPAALANAMMNELSGRLEKDAGAQVVFALEILADTEVKLRYT